jgi:hypothetical protein
MLVGGRWGVIGWIGIKLFIMVKRARIKRTIVERTRVGVVIKRIIIKYQWQWCLWGGSKNFWKNTINWRVYYNCWYIWRRIGVKMCSC